MHVESSFLRWWTIFAKLNYISWTIIQTNLQVYPFEWTYQSGYCICVDAFTGREISRNGCSIKFYSELMTA